MRKYKLRGKRIDNGEWVYGTGITDFLNIYPECKGKCWLWATSYQWIEVDPETVGQYTGRNDKNDKEIYEGEE